MGISSRVAGSGESVSLLKELRQRPGLLLLELGWRWSCGSFLLALGTYAGWRIWVPARPAIEGTGLLTLTQGKAMDAVLNDPEALVQAIAIAFGVLRGPVARVCLGLLPLACFCWVGAFAVGRTAVLARYDPRLPRRPWLLAAGEAARVGSLLAMLCVWGFMLDAGWRVSAGSNLLYAGLYGILCLGATAGMSILLGYFRRAVTIAMAIAQVRRMSFPSAFRRWRLVMRLERVQPIRVEVRRIRWLVFAVAAVLSVVPAPFGLGWPLVAWWVLLSLPPLVLTDAWRLGAFLILLRVVRERAEDRP